MKLVSTIETIETITVVFTSIVSSNIGGYLKQIVDPRIVIYYHPPMKLGKVMFSQVFVCSWNGGS